LKFNLSDNPTSGSVFQYYKFKESKKGANNPNFGKVSTNAIKIKVYDPNNNFLQEYESISELKQD